MSIDLSKYETFVANVTSQPSNNLSTFIARLDELAQLDSKLNMSLLLTAGIGLSSESGEFCEVVKKISFQGKPWNEDTRFHLYRELGDIIFYWINACRAIGVSPESVINENIAKLEARYPNGFSVQHSENRKSGDV